MRIIVLGLSILAVGIAWAEPEEVMVSGRCWDKIRLEPIEDVTIQFRNLETDRVYEVECDQSYQVDLPAGRYHIEAEAPGFLPYVSPEPPLPPEAANVFAPERGKTRNLFLTPEPAPQSQDSEDDTANVLIVPNPQLSTTFGPPP